MSKYNNKRPIAKVSTLKGRCPSGKVRFRERREAIDALHRIANIRNMATELTGSSERKEVRCYKCVDCAGVHITSLPKWIDRKLAA
jgi:hypothetical protein